MSIFTLHSNVLSDYRDFVRSFFTVADGGAREFIERELLEEARLWPEALLQVSPSYARVASVDELADRGVILPETAEIFRTERGSPSEILELNERGGAQRAARPGVPFHLYQHQVEALERAGRSESYVVTSGTGSGKSLTYFLPITASETFILRRLRSSAALNARHADTQTCSTEKDDGAEFFSQPLTGECDVTFVNSRLPF